MTWRPTSHTNYPWADDPSTSTPLDAANLQAAETEVVDWVSGNLGLLGIAATTTQTSAYAANAGDFVPVDTSGGAVTVTLPASVATGPYRREAGERVERRDCQRVGRCGV